MKYLVSLNFIIFSIPIWAKPIKPYFYDHNLDKVAKAAEQSGIKLYPTAKQALPPNSSDRINGMSVYISQVQFKVGKETAATVEFHIPEKNSLHSLSAHYG